LIFFDGHEAQLSWMVKAKVGASGEKSEYCHQVAKIEKRKGLRSLTRFSFNADVILLNGFGMARKLAIRE